MPRFSTAVTCMDGRIQLPVIAFLRDHFDVDYVDIISEPGVNAILAENSDKGVVKSIERRVALSITAHDSVGIAVVGHHDCAGNPVPDETQEIHTMAGVDFIRRSFGLPVIGLWVDQEWKVRRLDNPATGFRDGKRERNA